MNDRTVDLIAYLPQHLAGMQEFREICASEDIELHLIWDELTKAGTDMDLYNMSERQCAIWEKFFGIKNVSLQSLDDRRMTVRGYFSSQLPYTVEKLKSILDSMCGENGYSLKITTGNEVSIGIKMASKDASANVALVTRQMIPAHILLTVWLMYNRWSRFGDMTWGEAKAYTWEQLHSDSQFQTEALTV